MAASFSELEASSLFCPRCKQANPVRKRLLLVWPSGNKYDYLCAECGTANLPSRIARSANVENAWPDSEHRRANTSSELGAPIQRRCAVQTVPHRLHGHVAASVDVRLCVRSVRSLST